MSRLGRNDGNETASASRKKFDRKECDSHFAKMSPNHADRVSAEKAFHNARFSSGPSTQPSTKYYRALEEWYRDYFSRIMVLSASSILELGAGTQSLALQVDHANFKFESIDISEEAVAFAERHKL